MSWLQTQIRARVNSFRDHQGLPVFLTPEEEEARYTDAHLQHIIDGAMEIANAAPPPPRVIPPMLPGDVEQAAAGMAALNGLDFGHEMTESERQPYRESAADQIITARKKQELDRQAQLEKDGAFDGLDGH